ncbi:dimethyl sulfoxide reductase anchor subunit family protein [Jannaschia seohaensis]|uniref:DMSO reductase anchor subunit n=1 Tax=Jannaschia seohaensis TaxID=475081 RepID=A0A2Y9A9Q0_9RHOB|nr:DmsC/YnfH family molybdoenzyme membrane anchor subunit [Jannaschia seohaensis]PWJ20831.1 DMSO reductase anchor subunit [Jannaschia seohaensis]SSA41241.1 DMSO reductase anchor subunit [Jannaschia seohaensis]
MHPAPSVIIFSTLSGAGFGLLAFLGLGLPVVTGWVAFGFYLIGFALAVGGLLSAVFHLQNPKNAWRSYSQWRSSWLSREMWAAIGALLAMGLYAFLQVFFATTIAPLGWLGAALSLATVFTTSMIYAQLKTVPRWNQLPVTPLMFLSCALAGGALLSANLAAAGVLLLTAGGVTVWYWVAGDGRFAEAGSTARTATGLGGAVSLWEKPHTGENYLTREMVFQIGRKHAVKLRAIALVLMVGLPLILILLPMSHVTAVIAVLSHLAGVLTQRWLFFAEAEHVVGLYYGAHGAKAAA